MRNIFTPSVAKCSRNLSVLLLLCVSLSHRGNTQEAERVRANSPATRALRSYNVNNIVVNRYQDKDNLTKISVPENQMSLAPHQTYVLQPASARIENPALASYNSLDKEIRDSYALRDIQMLPEIFVQTGATGADQFVYRVAFASKLPMEYRFGPQYFAGAMKFFLVPEPGSSQSDLNIPVEIEVVSDDIHTINPSAKSIDHVNFPMTKISLQGERLADSAQVKIITKSNPDGYGTYIKVRPAIEITSTRTRFQGLGVQKIPITLQVVGASPSDDSVRVSFSPEKGTVQPASVYVHYGVPALVYLRSEGLGTARLTTLSAFSTNELEFRYEFPWLFIAMAILGGILGGAVKFLSDMEKLSFLKSVIKGIAFGFFGSVVYYVLGFSLLRFQVTDIFNEFAVLGFSALVAFFGVRKT